MEVFQVFCNAHHKMHFVRLFKYDLKCISCNNFPCQSLTGYYECNICNEEMCDKCFQTKMQRFCANGHNCKIYNEFEAPDTYTCQTCHKAPSQNNDKYFVCLQCPNYTCQVCVINANLNQMGLGQIGTQQQSTGFQFNGGFQQQTGLQQQNQY